MQGRNPFQGGMGFFTAVLCWEGPGYYASQSLSGWDGVFHLIREMELGSEGKGRNPFQGGMGFFTLLTAPEGAVKQESQSLSGWDGVFHALLRS